MRFVRVIINQPDRQQALFEHEGMNYVYSYVNNGMAHETMVFHSTGGDSFDANDIISDFGYVPSDEMMQRIVDIVDNDGTIDENHVEVNS